MNGFLLLSVYYFPVDTKELDDIENEDNKALIDEIKRTFLKSPLERPTMETVSSALGMLFIDMWHAIVVGSWSWSADGSNI